jgi:hypothetical protein
MNNKILTKLFENSKIIANYIKNDFDIKLSSKDKEILFPFIYNKLKLIFKKIVNKDKTLINICNTILKKYNIYDEKEVKKSTDKMSGGLELLLDNDEIINYIKIDNKKIVKEENNTLDNKIKLYFENILEYIRKKNIFENKIPKNSTIDKNIIIYFNYLLNKEQLNNEKNIKIKTEKKIISKLYDKLFLTYLDSYFINKNSIDINRIIINIDKLPKNIYILIKIINELILINKLIKTKKYNKIILFIIIICIISNICLKYKNLFDFFITFFLIYLMNLLIFN